ncbi:ABC transporter permease [Lewinella sp. IMCC34183]|uniref:ABC transporter permease n=1 Tax=Lewinella sp. IMCC34183 TaxID=2248762 RepID=UPI000E224910|nr:ABC transporter permease [Lewinella sp. IMCC34183]
MSLVTFGLSRLTPGDPVRQRMVVEGERTTGDDLLAYEQSYGRLAKRLNRDLPAFYFTLNNAALPDTLYRIVMEDRRRAVRELALTYGNWPRVQAYYRELLTARTATNAQLQTAARRLLVRGDADYLRRQLLTLDGLPAARPLREAYAAMVANPWPYRVLLPRLHWHGLRNQYHYYLRGVLHGDLGVSNINGQSVARKIAVALPRTALVNGVALLLVYLLAVPLGLYMARYRGSRFDRWATFITFLGFGVPAFWIATLLSTFFTNSAYGMNWFPSMGFAQIPRGMGWWRALGEHIHHLALPVLCLAYPSFAYVARHLRAAALEELGKPYVKTGLMKGLSGSQVLWRHVFRNAAFPLVTLLGGLLPALLAGSVLIESIFNLPGMGRLLFTAATAEDWPVVTALVLINGALTILGLVLADIAYALIDPRIRLGKTPPR